MSRSYSVKEMHIEVEQGLQRQGAFKRDAIFPEEIDWRLRSAEARIIKYRIKPDAENQDKFQVDSKYLSDIQPIIVSNYKLPVITTTEELYGILPYNFSYLTSDRSRILLDCDAAWTNRTVAKTGRLLSYKLGDSALLVPPYYKTIKFEIAGVTTNLTIPGFSSKNTKYEIVDYIIYEMSKLGYEMYWERYNDKYAPDTFYIYTEIASVTPIITVDGTVLVNTINPYPLTFVTTTYGKEVVNRGVKADFKWDHIYNNYYTKTKHSSPISNVAQNRLYVHVDKSFLVSQLLIDYIRTPRKISLSLNQTSELPALHEEICSVAVEMILNDIEGTNYRNKTESNINRLE